MSDLDHQWPLGKNNNAKSVNRSMGDSDAHTKNSTALNVK